MAVGVGASGFVGIAPEAVSGTYLAPTKYLLLRSESLNYAQDTVWRRPLRGIADVAGAIPGNSRIEGDIEIEVTADQLPHLFKGSRQSVVKSGTAPYIYTYTPTAVAVPTNTLSITVVRNGVSFGYVGCVISSFTMTIDEGILVMTCSILGTGEASQAIPTPTYPTAIPFGMGMYNVQIPTATQVFDTDSFEFSVEDNAEAQYRLKSTGTGAQFIKYGERSVAVSVERDFESRTEYDAYKALTAQSVRLIATRDANNIVQITVPAAIKDSYEIAGLSGQADLIRASVSYNGVYDTTTSKAYELIVTTSENVT